MPVCIKCGANLETTYKFCESCGNPVQQQIKTSVSDSGACDSLSSKHSVCSCCGKILSASDRFCGKCGYPVQKNNQTSTSKNAQTSAYNIVPPVNIVFQPQSEQERIVSELNKMCEYFEKVQALYDVYDHFFMMRRSIIRDAEIAQKDDSREDKVALELIVFGIFILALGPWIGNILSIIGSVFSVIYLLLSALVGGLMCLGGSQLMIHAIENMRDYAKEIEECNAKLTSTSIKLTQHYANYGYCIVGPEYTNPRILTRIRDIMSSKRADTLDNAIKTLYHDCRRREIWARDIIEGGININNAQGAKTACAFIPSNYFFDKKFRYFF